MKTGERFWQLVAITFLILIAYGLAELYDINVAQQKQLESQSQLLAKQQAMLNNNRWQANLSATERIQKSWMAFLPAEKSPTFAKARLLSDLRALAKDVGIANVGVTATDAEGGDKADAAAGAYGSKAAYQSASDKKKADTLPVGLQMIKLTITGRFDPASFTRFLHSLEETQRFTVIERVVVRGTQLEVGIRCYWRVESALEKSKTTLPATKGL